MRRIALTSMLAIGLSLPAHADFVEADWQTSGDNLAVLDTTTDLEWLDLSLTQNRSYDNVTTSLATDFDGWRLPTLGEVTALFNGFFPTYSDTGFGFADFTPGSAIHTAGQLWDTLFNSDGNGAVQTLGAFNDNGTVRVTGTFDYGPAIRITSPGYNPLQDYGTIATPGVSTFLVRNVVQAPIDPTPPGGQPGGETPTDVSAPVGVVSMLTLAFLGWTRRKRTA